MIRGLDVSHWQSRAAFTAAAVKGYNPSFLVAKATEGRTFRDPAFRSNLNIGQSINVPVLGAYHYLRHGYIAEQLDNFLDVVKDPRGLMIQLDVEHKTVTYTDVADFIRYWNQRTSNYPIFIYTGDWFWQGKKFPNGSRLAPLWAVPNRGYPGKNFRSTDWVAGYGGWSNLTIAQYAVNPTIGDLNYYNGTLENLIRNHTRGGQGAPQVPTGDEQHLYIILPGDTLKIVSQKVYGNREDWEVIRDANRTLLTGDIFPTGSNGDTDLPDGYQLVIPEHDPSHPSTEKRKYTVHKGDTLSSIAHLYYGDASKWRRIFNANRKRIKDPNLIHPGWILTIP